MYELISQTEIYQDVRKLYNCFRCKR